MASITWKNYKAIMGKPLPKCEGGAVIFFFGSECYDVTLDTATETLVNSSDMCMQGGPYFAAAYKAYPGQVQDGNLLFTAQLISAALIRSDTTSCGEGDLPNLCF